MLDLNLLVLEGTISSKFYVQTGVNDKGISAINFTLTNAPSEGKRFKYACVAWRTDPEKFQEDYKEGDFIRVTGHLQQSPYPIPDGNGKITYLGKVSADKIDVITSISDV